MTNPHIDEYGNKRWFNSDGQLHREDGPAYIINEIEIYGSKQVLHREDGPAVESSYIKHWFKNGTCHRDDGPAIEYPDGTKDWYKNGLRHRDDGPAVEYINGSKHWWIKGINITNEVEQWIIDNNFPKYEEWDDSIKVLFKLKFG